MTQWDTTLHLSKKLLELGKFDLQIPFTKRGVPVVNILDVNKKELAFQYKDLPAYFRTDPESLAQEQPVNPPPGLEVYHADSRQHLSLDSLIPKKEDQH